MVSGLSEVTQSEGRRLEEQRLCQPLSRQVDSGPTVRGNAGKEKLGLFCCAKLPGMRSADLTCEQVENLAEHIGQMLAYLHKLDQRIVANNFPVDDPVRAANAAALDAVATLGLRVESLKIPADGGHGPRVVDILGRKPRKHWKR
jgi:hypothetical protein